MPAYDRFLIRCSSRCVHSVDPSGLHPVHGIGITPRRVMAVDASSFSNAGYPPMREHILLRLKEVQHGGDDRLTVSAAGPYHTSHC